MMTDVKLLLRKSPRLVATKRRVFSQFDFSVIDIVSTFAAFKPNSAGRYRARAKMTVEAINTTPSLLAELSRQFDSQQVSLTSIEGFPRNELQIDSANTLGKIFETSGSDKARHGYHLLYGSILQQRAVVRKILEIGLGTNNTEIVSTMGLSGVPGASLRAFRDFCPNAEIYGADIDERILFSEDRIQTFYVDQLDPSTFDRLKSRIGDQFDLVIDDGLHSPNANIASLIFGLQVVKPGGWVVIEDISTEAEKIWEIVAAILPAEMFRAHIVRASTTLLFAVQAIAPDSGT